MRGCKWATGLALGCLLVACGDDEGGTVSGASSGGAEDSSGSSSGAPMITEASVVVAADVASACGMTGATRVELHATRFACVNPLPAPCTVPDPPRPTIGDGVDCPSTDSAQALHVELTSAGRYHVELVTFAGDAELSRICHGVGGEAELLVTDEQFDDDMIFDLSVLDGSSC